MDDATTVIDTVEYKKLVPGKEYTLKGTLHVKVTDEEGNVTEKALEVDGKPVTAETTFTPEKADGKVDVLVPGKEYTLKGTLHVKVTDEEGNVTEKALEVDGKPVTAETTFTPEKADGKVDVVFTASP